MVKVGSRVLGWLGGQSHSVSSLPLGRGWTAHRDMPTPSGPTFKERWAKQRH